MVWGSMSYNGCGMLEFIEGIMTKEIYLDIVKKNVRTSARKLGIGRRFVFQQDSDPKHTAKIVQEYFKKNKISILDWPAQSPDLNPIEHLWSVLKKKVSERHPSNLANLKQIIQEEWDKIDASVTQKLVESMPRRCHAVLKVKGGHTKY